MALLPRALRRAITRASRAYAAFELAQAAIRRFLWIAGIGTVAALVAVAQSWFYRLTPLGRFALVIAAICLVLLTLGLLLWLARLWLRREVVETVDGFLSELLGWGIVRGAGSSSLPVWRPNWRGVRGGLQRRTYGP